MKGLITAWTFHHNVKCETIFSLFYYCRINSRRKAVLNGAKRESGNGFMIINGSKEKCFSGDKEPRARTVHDIKAKFSSPLVRTETNHTVQKYKRSNIMADV